MEKPVTLCKISDIRDGGDRGVEVGRGAQALDLVLLRRGGKVFAYLKRCPHMGTPLETFPDKFLDSTRNLLICSTHGTRFRVRDGHCVAGPCTGAALRRVRIEVKGGRVRLSGRDSIKDPTKTRNDLR